jgi:uncharacterized glyoxalase superfamily protein PhnB
MSELTPYICVSDAQAAIQGYGDALGAEIVVEPIIMDDGRVGHCELEVAGARWMMSDEFEGYGIAVPDPTRGATVTLHLTVEDCDAAAARVTRAGVAMTRGPEDSPAGRVAVFTDPFGHRWFLNQPFAES